MGLAQLVFRERAGERQSLLRSAFLSEGVEADIGDVREEGRRRTLECLGCGCAVDWVAARGRHAEAKRRMAKVHVFHGPREGRRGQVGHSNPLRTAFGPPPVRGAGPRSPIRGRARGSHLGPPPVSAPAWLAGFEGGGGAS